MPLSRFVARSLPLAGLAALFLLPCELALRLADFEYPSAGRRTVVWNRARDLEMRSATGLHVLDRGEIWKPRPGAAIPWTKNEQVNSAGFRGPLLEKSKTPGVLRVALLGPSTAFGEGVAWQDTYAALLVRILGDHGVKAEVLDAAVMDSTLRQGLERYRRDVRPYAPDIVVSAYSGLHEHTEAPESASDDDRITRGVSMPDWSSSAPIRDHVRVVQAAAWLWAVFSHDYWDERETVLQERRLAKTIGTFDSAGVRRVSPAEMRDGMIELATEVRSDGAELLVLLIPHKPGGPLDSAVMHYYQKALEIGCELEHIPVVQGRLAYFQGVTTGIKPEDLFLEDGESSDCGHVLLAQALVDEILPRVPAIVR